MKIILEEDESTRGTTVGIAPVIRVRRTPTGKSMEIMLGVSYRKTKKKDVPGLLFNFCPCCGTNINWWDEEVEKEKTRKPSDIEKLRTQAAGRLVRSKGKKITEAPRMGTGKLVDRRHLQRGAQRAATR